jgi:solute carrier family 39 (zinc transporter), member 1/2/3
MLFLLFKIVVAENSEDCVVSGPALDSYSVPKRIITLLLVLLISIIASVLPILYKRYNNNSNLLLSCLKLFGTGVLISTAFVHMLPPAVEILSNRCLPEVFRSYENWAGTLFLFGFLVTHLLQQLASDITRSMDGYVAVDEECHHVHHLSPSQREHSIIANALEFGLCSHSVIVGFTLGTIEHDFTALFYAIMVHQFFEGMALSSVVVEASLSTSKTVWMVLLYSFSTPLGVLLGICFRATSTQSIHVQLAIGISESFCAGVLSYDSIANLMSLHFFGEYYRSCSRKERYLHILALWLGVIAMTVLGIWA